MQCHRQQQQRAHERARAGDDQWVDLADGDADQQIRHAP
jgi:hypothetical protein